MVYLNDIKISNFRNYSNLNIKFSRNINIFVGDNALGKTNLIESIYVLALTKSFRPVNDISLLKTNEISYQLVGNIYKNDFVDELKIIYNESGKTYFINDKKTLKTKIIYQI